MMKYLCVLLVGVAVAASLSGCGGDGTTQTDFTSFVKQLLASTADTTEPVDIKGLLFTFTEDEAAFRDVL